MRMEKHACNMVNISVVFFLAYFSNGIFLNISRESPTLVENSWRNNAVVMIIPHRRIRR